MNLEGAQLQTLIIALGGFIILLGAISAITEMRKLRRLREQGVRTVATLIDKDVPTTGSSPCRKISFDVNNIKKQGVFCYSTFPSSFKNNGDTIEVYVHPDINVDDNRSHRDIIPVKGKNRWYTTGSIAFGVIIILVSFLFRAIGW